MTALPAPEAWRPLLEHHRELFGELRQGARIGVAARTELGRPEARMVVWEARPEGMVAEWHPFPGFQGAGVDVLLVGNDDSLEEIGGQLDGEALPLLRRQIREGGVVTYLLRRQCELLDAGYEDLLERLGVAFLGACR